jgi:hypothetical protein
MFQSPLLIVISEFYELDVRIVIPFFSVPYFRFRVVAFCTLSSIYFRLAFLFDLVRLISYVTDGPEDREVCFVKHTLGMGVPA